ncbi:IS1 family transposase, partial [Escherichia coli]|uniref:IS1 family transposase n=1 Tax=Escherichia coli TaxID=562 RepID=UPI00201A4253
LLCVWRRRPIVLERVVCRERQMCIGGKRYTQRIERHNLNLRQHLARLGRKSLSFSKSVELHDKVIGHYLNIKHYQ